MRESLRHLLMQRSVARGRFVLSSGKTSNYYVDCRKTTIHPEGAWLIGKMLEPIVAEHRPTIDSVGGLTLGADPLSLAIAIQSQSSGHPIRCFTVRKAAKEHGRGKRIEGSFELGDHVLVLEDVVTTGASALLAVEALQEAGAHIEGVLALVDREEGGRRRIEDAGLSLTSVFAISELL